VYEGLVRDVKSTKRDLYYRNVALFKSQSVVDRLLSQLELTYECERHEFNVVASAKGLLFGPAAITMTDGQVLDLSSQARNITDVEHYAAIDLSNIETVLVVEKDAVFQTLCQSVSAAPASHPCKNWLLLTAKGYPDVSSRQALKFIEASITTSTDVSIRAIPLLCLVDLDPHGIEILATWKYGSVARAAHSRHLAVTSLRWLGVHVEEIADVAAHMLPLTPADNRKADALLCRKWCTGSMQSRNWRQQVMRLKQLQLKAEIEILAEKQDGLLSTLTNWIQYGNWL
ncbi:Spo11/DNA topoisomerase VI subunit A, partial [Protomyces lactucae-debilis]